MAGRRHRDAENPGELPGHARHAAFQPVAAVLGDAGGEAFHQAGLVRGDDGDYQSVHADVPFGRRRRVAV